MTTLARIRTKVRRLTGYSSTFHLSDADIDQYINDFYLYDVPNNLKLLNLKTVYTFYTSPNIDVYTFPKNSYSTIEPPLYIAGYESAYTQSREQLFRIYPPVNVNETLATGNGTNGPYAFTITNKPVLRNQVTISTTDISGNNLVGNDNGSGGFTGNITAGAINYVTGAITGLTFSANVSSGADIKVQSVPYVASRPAMALFYEESITMRPVPDQSYKVDINTYVFPTQLVNDTDHPETDDMWQYLAVGAAKKILEDNMSFDDLAKIVPLYEEQEKLTLRRTIQQNRPVRSTTIYTEQAEFAYGNLGSPIF